MRRVVHIVTHLGGGVGRVLTNIVWQSERVGKYRHEILCLDYLSETAEKLVRDAGVSVKDKVKYEDIYTAAEDADIVQLDWWNHPLLYKCLYTMKIPPVRLLVYAHVAGYYPPMVLTRHIINFSDLFVASTPYTLAHPIIRNLPESSKSKIKVVFVSGGISRVADITPKPHKHFNVGYIGTVDFCKMHPDYVKMHSSIQIPKARFIVCGGGIEDVLKRQASALNDEKRFIFKGFVENINPVLETLDVFGYPLCREHYGTGEQALIEAMTAGVPPVVFSHGAEMHIVRQDETGVIVNDIGEYVDAIEYLYGNPKKRKQMGINAREYAKENFGIEKTVDKFEQLYDELMKEPKIQREYGTSTSNKKSIHGLAVSSGSSIFIKSLGEHAKNYIISATSENLNELLSADKEIADCTHSMRTETRGSVFHYHRVFPDDVYLMFWSALILRAQGKHGQAVKLFKNARNQGFKHWRVFLYLGKSAFAIEDAATVKETIEKINESCPSFSIEKNFYEDL